MYLGPRVFAAEAENGADLSPGPDGKLISTEERMQHVQQTRSQDDTAVPGTVQDCSLYNVVPNAFYTLPSLTLYTTPFHYRNLPYILFFSKLVHAPLPFGPAWLFRLCPEQSNV